jgi:hypothetical protein
MEVWKRREKFLPIPQAVLCEILGQDLAREVRSDRGYLTFSDLEICSEPLSYTARYCSGPYAGNEIRHGEKVAMLVMPFDDSTAMIIDAHGRFMGEVPLYNRVLPIDPSAFGSTAPFDSRPDIRSADLTRAAGEKHSRIADILEPTRILHREEVREARDLREHNRRVISGEPLTDPERRSAAAMQGQRSAAANRLQSHGSAFDDGDYSPAAAPSAFDSLGEEEDLPEAL